MTREQREKHKQREQRAGRRLLPDKLRIHPGIIQRVGRKWIARFAVGDPDHPGTQAYAEASGPDVALRKAFDDAIDRLLKEEAP